MTIDALLEPFAHFGVRLGLEAIQQLLANLGNPHAEVPVIHVAGSNGKGSVCAFLSSMLTEAGYRVGRYTSPHLIHWTERICLNGEPIAEDELKQLLEKVIAVGRSQHPVPTQFEIMTAAAWLYFAQKQVDVAVVEVGLGGRLDSTNVCDRPLISVITSISLEHTAILGSTLAAIAAEKAGILKPECPAVIGQLPPEANAVIYRRAFQLGCETTYPQPAKDLGAGWAEYRGIEEYEIEIESPDPDEIGAVHLLTTIRYHLPLPGAIQRHNSALAIATLQILREGGWKISDDDIVDGIAKTQWAGRLQWFQWGDHQILIDGAHNPASAEVLREFLNDLTQQKIDSQSSASLHPVPFAPSLSIHWVVGMLANKDHTLILQTLLRSSDRLYLVPVPDHKSAEPEQMVLLAQKICPDLQHCQPYPDVFAALNAALQATQTTKDGSSQELIVLCGSLYLIGSFLSKVQV